jgi:hypothetical protein
MPVQIARFLPQVLVLRLLLAARARVAAGRPDRGDVPGWVMVTIMTAGLVTALWFIAEERLSAIFTDALDGVVGGP